MARRKFELPGIQDLSKEQEAARALPKDGQHLIVGGPGTGKSVLALLRCRRHQREGDDYLFLVYNHLLHRASGQLFGEDLKSDTWIAWFRRTFRGYTGRNVPLLPPQPNGFKPEDWEAVERAVADVKDFGPAKTKPYLVIDEGQDMPPAFYRTLFALGFQNFFVVADQNQQINDGENSSREDLQINLNLDAEEVIELTRNYRNGYTVARFAREFYTSRTSPPPVLPEGVATRRTAPVLYLHGSVDLTRVADAILRYSDRDTKRLIGIMAPNDSVRAQYVKALQASRVALDKPKPKIDTFYGDHRPDVSFEQCRILVINAQACKGLEFDTAILVDIDGHRYSAADPDATKRLFYVMVARARERVFLFASGRGRIDDVLPDDPAVLLRREI